MMRFTSREIRDLIISMVIITVLFAYIFSGRTLPSFSLIVVTFIAVGLGFILHELAHKFVAMRYGFWAEYRLWVEGLIFAIITAALGFLFVAPGAVYIHGEYISREQNGKISASGPATNLILAGLFFLLLYYFPSGELVTTIGVLGFYVNSFLAMINLIPISMLDGAKIIRWNPIIWVVMAGITGVMVFYAFTGLVF
ncbi:MAG: site-2 protease family protein [Methanobacteriaceae archaeon]|jgi:Zn-dependent protease|nr:site-2 protease family protein [Methanobacteriaceae archaeon]